MYHLFIYFFGRILFFIIKMDNQERENFNQELREHAHIMLDITRGIILCFKGPLGKKQRLLNTLKKVDELCADKTRRIKSANLLKMIDCVLRLKKEAEEINE